MTRTELTVAISEKTEKTVRNISKNTPLILPAHSILGFKPAKEFVNKASNLEG